MKWADLLMIKSKNDVSYKAAFLYNSWLNNRLAANEPIDKIFRELLSASVVFSMSLQPTSTKLKMID